MVTMKELVGMKEIAERLDVPRTTASMWHLRHATTGFPEPVADLRMGPVFEWEDVKKWFEQKTGVPVVEEAP